MITVTIKACLKPCLRLYCKSESKRYGKGIANSFPTHCMHEFFIESYRCELFNLTGTVRKVELSSTFTTAVCESWNVSNIYTWDNAGDLKYSWTRLTVRIIGVIKRQFFHLVRHVFHNSNL